MLVVAGPPGSGKTTAFPLSAMGIDAFNIDDRCAQLVGSYQAIPREVRVAIARECERFVGQHIQAQRSFAVETTVRTLAAVRQAEEAATCGFVTELRYIATSSPELNVQRVLQRAQAGGHAASGGEVREIYAKSLANLAEAVRAFEHSTVYDATEQWALPRAVAVSAAGVLQVEADAPSWAREALRPSH